MISAAYQVLLGDLKERTRMRYLRVFVRAWSRKLIVQGVIAQISLFMYG